MAGRLEVIVAITKRMTSRSIPPIDAKGGDRISSSTTFSNLPPPGPQKSVPEVEILDAQSPTNSLKKKKQKIKGKVHTQSKLSLRHDLVPLVVSFKNNSNLLNLLTNS
ncbi:uncharacterized protein DS421_19g657230 [Arachis hypogaea]|uniref:Uncharacterized protein n=1 Tax=Arachis hypogaea TaxID=3818 RepID=A0A6B9VAA3_ARAHY|nr:uncharacterized protein DS421_19g657230 [Arachis hypogaea]